VSRVIAATREGATDRPAFGATFGTPGAFPDARRARVLWLGLSQGAETLSALAGALEQALLARGFPAAERAFSPHLTLGRVRRPERDWGARLGEVAAGLEDGWAPPFTVDRVAVVHSTLSPGGSIYRVCAEAALAA
jgi:2'-5' RNA ligase